MKIIIIICAISFAMNFFAKYFFTQLNKRKGEKILNLYSHIDLKKVEVKISETRINTLTNRGGTLGYLNAIMFYSDGLLIFTQNEKYNFEEINITLPLIINLETIEKIIIKSDEYILYSGQKKINIYSEKENDLLKIIFNNLQNNILKT
ncbi:hypothetical protein [Flavobacterium saliperosum]|nr:hypothetical protein [Flavobacterium saliperosum]